MREFHPEPRQLYTLGRRFTRSYIRQAFVVTEGADVADMAMSPPTRKPSRGHCKSNRHFDPSRLLQHEQQEATYQDE